MTIDNLLLLIFLVIATEAMTEIIVAAKITDGFRFKIAKLAHPLPPEGEPPSEPTSSRRFWIFLHDLFNCGYCTSVWVAMIWALFSPWFLHFGVECWITRQICWVVNWAIAVLVLHRLSNWIHILFSLIKKGRVRTYDIELKLEVKDGSSGQCIVEGEPTAGSGDPQTS